MAGKRTDRKGTFGDAALPVARRYLWPRGRARGVIIGLLLALAGLGYVLFDVFVRRGSFVAGGPLSASHASLEQSCASCHQGFAAVRDESCATCHEKYGDELGAYSFAAHQLYRSDDFQRLVPSPDQLPCSACHPEHRGRAAAITAVADGRCVGCHPFGSFAREHPPFELAAAADPAGLDFPHVRHVREVMDRESLADLERACLYCHNPRPDGRSFEPLDFDRHCDACHLTTTVATPRLPLENGDEPGVETLAMIRARGDPGSRWAYFTNPGELRQTGSWLSKSPLHHPDPWVMDNLRRLRGELYPDAGLADLLEVSADVPAEDARVLYREALATLETQARDLRSRPEPEIQAELARIEALIESLGRRVDDPYATLDPSKFVLALGEVDPDVDPEHRAAAEELIAELTAPCRQCHLLERATLVRVQKDQRVLRRAEFDHRAHVIQRRCLDCHFAIPIETAITAGEKELPAEVDRSAIQNLPSIEVCRECHQPAVAGAGCVGCHLYHPDSSRHSRLLLTLEGGDG